MTSTLAALPVPILSHPHWRVEIRPDAYREERITSLPACIRLIEETAVRLRGWDYPHLSHRDTERAFGQNWVASWSTFRNHLEYWRLFQSGQFIHRFSIAEEDPTWKQELMRWVSLPTAETPALRGVVSFVNFIYTTTEIFEFSSRLAQKGLFDGKAVIDIQLVGMDGFALTEVNRHWSSSPRLSSSPIGKTWEFTAESLITESPNKAKEVVVWFMHRFGWMDPNVPQIEKDQQELIKNR